MMSFKPNYWDSQEWNIAYYGANWGGVRGAYFYNGGSTQPYSLSLTSKPFDATGKSKVILAFMYSVGSNQTTFVGIKDIVNITIDCQLVKVYDMNGQMLMQTSDKQVNIGNLANGTYIFEVTLTDGSKAYSKVIKK